MKYCAHCGLPVAPGCEQHVQDVPQSRPRVVKVDKPKRQEQSIHPGKRNKKHANEL